MASANCCLVAQSCLTLWDPMACSMPCFPVLYLPYPRACSRSCALNWGSSSHFILCHPLSSWLQCAKGKCRFIAGSTMATHSSTLAWKIPWMEEPGGLQSMGSLRVRHNWATSLSLFTFMNWRRKWQPTPVFLPGESQGWGSLVGCRPWGRTESDTTEAT